jgi:hypothetical protein
MLTVLPCWHKAVAPAGTVMVHDMMIYAGSRGLEQECMRVVTVERAIHHLAVDQCDPLGCPVGHHNYRMPCGACACIVCK